MERITFLENEVVLLDQAIANINLNIKLGVKIRSGSERLVKRKIAIKAEILALKRTVKVEEFA